MVYVSSVWEVLCWFFVGSVNVFAVFVVAESKSFSSKRFFSKGQFGSICEKRSRTSVRTRLQDSCGGVDEQVV